MSKLNKFIEQLDGNEDFEHLKTTLGIMRTCMEQHFRDFPPSQQFSTCPQCGYAESRVVDVIDGVGVVTLRCHRDRRHERPFEFSGNIWRTRS